MADKKISQLTALAASSVAPSTDVLAIVDSSATETKKITAKDVVDGALNTQTANGVVYLNGSKEATAGSVVTYDGTTFKVDGAVTINDSGADVDFRVEGDTDSNLLFVDASADNVGIGTSSPGAKLDVFESDFAKISRFNRTSADTGAQVTAARVKSISSGDMGDGFGTALVFSIQDTANTENDIGFIGAVRSGADNSGALTFSTSAAGTATVKMRLDPSGNLGLGVTPSAWFSTWRNIELGGADTTFAGNGTGPVRLVRNAYINTSGDWIYKNSDYASHYQQTNGQHAWYSAGSGTAGNTITFTQAMTLDSGGALGIGTTSPGSALHVARPNGTNTYVQIAQTSLESWQIGLTGGSTALSFLNSGTERARITSGGAALFGTNSDFAFAGTPLINSSTANCIFANTTSGAGTGYLLFQGRSGAANVNTAGTAVFNVFDSGNVTNTNNSYGQISDVKTKQDIVDAASQWDDIKSVRVRKFRFKNNPEGALQIGVVAQELEQVSPGLIDETPDRDVEGNDLGTTTKSVKYSVLYMKAIKALQEAMTRIEALEAEVATLKGAN